MAKATKQPKTFLHATRRRQSEYISVVHGASVQLLLVSPLAIRANGEMMESPNPSALFPEPSAY